MIAFGKAAVSAQAQTDAQMRRGSTFQAPSLSCAEQARIRYHTGVRRASIWNL